MDRAIRVGEKEEQLPKEQKVAQEQNAFVR